MLGSKVAYVSQKAFKGIKECTHASVSRDVAMPRILIQTPSFSQESFGFFAC